MTALCQNFSHFICPLTVRIVEPVSSIYFFPVLHFPLRLGELQACPFPDVVFPPLPPSALSSSPFTVPCKMVLARPGECSLRIFTIVRRSSCGPIACWILARPSSIRQSVQLSSYPLIQTSNHLSILIALQKLTALTAVPNTPRASGSAEWPCRHTPLHQSLPTSPPVLVAPTDTPHTS